MRLRASAVLANEGIDLLDVEDQSPLLADVADLLPGIVLVLGLHIVSFHPIPSSKRTHLKVEHRRLSGGLIVRALEVLVQLLIPS